MNKSPFEVTADHLQRRFDILENRMGLAAIAASTDRANSHAELLYKIDSSAYQDYIHLFSSETGSLLDATEEEADQIFDEFRDAFGAIDGYKLASVEPGVLNLIKGVSADDRNLFRPYIRLTYDASQTDGPEYEKVFKAVTFQKTAITERLPINDEDKQVIHQAFERLNKLNSSDGA